MASVPSPPPSQRNPPSATDSVNSAPHSPKNQVEGATNNGFSHGDEKNGDFADLDHLDSTQCIDRFRRYDAEYTRRLMSKYFSGKTLYGGNMFDEQMTINDEVIRSSRLSCFRSYANPVVGSEEQCSNGSTSLSETQANIPNGKHMPKKTN